MAHFLNSPFSQGVHLQGFQRYKTILGHARRRRQRRPGGALQVDTSLIKTAFGTCFIRIFSQGIHLKGCQRCSTPLGHARRRRQLQHGQSLQVNELF